MKHYIFFVIFLISVVFPYIAFGDEGWVINRESNSVTIFKTTDNTESTGSPITVGNVPIDIDIYNNTNIYVTNYGSNSISVIDRVTKTVISTITNGPMGGFFQPTGLTIAKTDLSKILVTPIPPEVFATIAVIDRVNLSSETWGGSLRFIDPLTNSVIDEWGIGEAGYDPVDIAFTQANNAFWLTSSVSNKVTQVRFTSSGPPFTGAATFNDITDASLLKPAKMVVNDAGDTIYVMNTDAGATKVTVIDYNGYVTGKITVGAPQIDAVLIGSHIYISLANNTVAIHNATSPFAPVGSYGPFSGVAVSGVGKSSDNFLYVGSGTGETKIYKVDISTNTITDLSFSQSYPLEFLFTEDTEPPPIFPGGGGGGGCYIATAGYGGQNVPQVKKLITLRHRYVQSNSAGKVFLTLYDLYGKKIAEGIKKEDTSGAFSRIAFTPLVLVSQIIEAPFIVRLLILIFIFIVLALGVIFLRKIAKVDTG